MNKLILSVLCMLALLVCITPCFAAPSSAAAANGVSAEERVINLPQDAGKWYISVVGKENDARYNEIIGWFSTDAHLSALKDQVFFNPVTTDSDTYKERYADNIKGLPTVRLQKNDGSVVYEATGQNLPMTADGLYGALANGVNGATDSKATCPWRRKHQAQPEPKPNPNPDVKPDPNGDPPAQPIDNDGAPNLDDVPAEIAVAWLWLAPLCFGGFLIGLVCGYGKPLWHKMRMSR